MFPYSILCALLSLSHASFLLIEPRDRLAPTPQGAYEICWLGPQSSRLDTLKIDIENYISTQFKKVPIEVLFVGNCLQTKNPFFPIGISFYDDDENPLGIKNELNLTIPSDSLNYPGHPTTYSNGFWAQENLLDVVLTSQFTDVRIQLHEQQKSLSVSGKHNLILSIALHEVMHAFGFGHEHERPDALDKKKSLLQKTVDKKILTRFDDQSVMFNGFTYTFDFEKSPIGLSELDILGLKILYLEYKAKR